MNALIMYVLKNEGTLTFRPNDSKYTLGEALGDLTGVGALYNLGADAAIMQRNQRIINLYHVNICHEKNPQINRRFNSRIEFFETKNQMLSRSIITKITYIGSIILTMAGTYYSNSILQGVGITSLSAHAIGFITRAGFSASDHSLEARERHLFQSF